jgi:4-diphosphocytidyl-2-C-methyl-D-erythritol kinase
MNSLQINSPAKINLFLHVTSQIPTGYHTLDSLVAFTQDIYDIISISHSDKYHLDINGPFAEKLRAHNNIITTAVNLLSKQYNLAPTIKISLTKNLPIASGIGGGSGNAASVVKLLCQLWNLNPSKQELLVILKKLGADVPMFYINHACYFNGIGEILAPLTSFPELWAILINPGITISTPDIFKMGLKQHFKPEITHRYSFNNTHKLINFLNDTQNDLYFNSLKLAPILDDIIKTLASTEGCMLARMSGSGATCFGLFENIEQAENNLKILRKTFPEFWIKLTKLI